MPPMSRAQRVQRIAQLREQAAAIADEIGRLEREDDGFVAYLGRAQAARKEPLGYADFARYAVAFEQLEAQWQQAGRPSAWSQLALLNRLREVLLAPAPSAAPVAAAAPAAARAPVAAAGRPGAAVAPPRPAPAPARPAAPPPAAPAPAPTSLRNGPTRTTPAPHQAPMAPTAAQAAANASAAKEAQRAASHANLAEQHSPILNEVVELAKRAEEEFRLAQLPAGLASTDRATYLLERVYQAPPALTNRVIKLLDDAGRNSQMADAEKQRWEQIKARLETVLAESA